MSWTLTLSLAGALQLLGTSSFASTSQNISGWNEPQPDARAIAALEVDWQLELPREGFTRALRLRLPEIQLDGAAPRAPTSATVLITERAATGEILLVLRLGDGRSYRRVFARSPEQPARAVASTLANLIVAIEVQQLPPDPEPPVDPELPDATTTAVDDDTSAETETVDSNTATSSGTQTEPAELETSSPPPGATTRDRRRRTQPPKRRRSGRVHAQKAPIIRKASPPRAPAIESSLGLYGGGVLVPEPLTAGWGGRLELGYRHSRPVRIGMRAAVLHTPLREARFRALRVAGWLWIGSGIQLRPILELRASLAIGVENWWVSDLDGSAITPDHPSLLRSDLQFGPHWQLGRAQGHELTLGFDLVVGYGGQIDRPTDTNGSTGGWLPPLVRSPGGQKLATFGGFELGLTLELRWTAYLRAAPSASSSGPSE